MIEIDGSYGEGGGQILRSAVAMAALTHESIRVFNIRARRTNPGLRAQHLNAILALKKLCNGDVKGAELNSKEIEFHPGKISGGSISINIGTAGSISLVLQALMLPAMFAGKDVRIKISGGTDVRWSPPIDYLRFVTIPILQKFGYRGEIELIRRGYYPKGGGEVIARIEPVESLEEILLEEPGEILSIEGISHAHSNLEKAKVARRQMKAARPLLFNKFPREMEIQQEYSNALSYGSGITLWVNTEHSILGADSMGEAGKRAELVGGEAAKTLLEEMASGAALDRYMADQIVPYLAIAGGRVTVSQVTEHCKTNIGIMRRFDFELKIKENSIIAQKQPP